LSYEDIGKLHSKFGGIIDYINENRLNNTISKIGKVTKSTIKTIMKEFCDDILKDYINDHPYISQEITEDVKLQLINIVGSNGYIVLNNYMKSQMAETKKHRKDKKKHT
jgi:hypothetical protein